MWKEKYFENYSSQSFLKIYMTKEMVILKMLCSEFSLMETMWKEEKKKKQEIEMITSPFHLMILC